MSRRKLSGWILLLAPVTFAACGNSKSDGDSDGSGATSGAGASARAGDGGGAGASGSSGASSTGGGDAGASGAGGGDAGASAAGGDAGASGAGGGDAGASGAGTSGSGGGPSHASDLLCGERPGGTMQAAHVLRFESADGLTIVQLRRVFDDYGVGESSLYHLESFAVVHDGATTCIDDTTLAYVNSHHNWSDVAEAAASDRTYRLSFELDTVNGGLAARLTILGTDAAALFEAPLIPTGSPPFCWTCPGSTSVGISELMSDNVSAHADEAGDFEPWIELYNVTSEDIDLEGYTLSNDFTDRRLWSFPSVTVPRAGVLVIFVDGEPEEGPLHTSFRLDPEAGELVLTRPNGTTDGGLVYSSVPADRSLAYDWSSAGYVEAEPSPGLPPPE